MSDNRTREHIVTLGAALGNGADAQSPASEELIFSSSLPTADSLNAGLLGNDVAGAGLLRDDPTLHVSPAAQIHNVVFIDSRVPDLQGLLAGLKPGEQAFVIDAKSDGLTQIADILKAYHLTGLTGIQFVAHGAAGEISLGSTALDDAHLAGHAAALSAIGAALAHGGDLSLFSCDVARGALGHDFIADLSAYAGGVDVSAATHEVGSAALGGSWTLDFSTGHADGFIPFTQVALSNFDGVLGNPTMTGFNTDVTFNENTVNASPQLFMGNVNFSYDGDFNFTYLNISGLLAEDRLTIRNQGTGAGLIGVSGSNITYGGVVIATYTGGQGDDMLLQFNGNATSTAVSHLFDNLLYADVSDSPTADRRLTFSTEFFNNVQNNTLNFTGPSFTEQTGANNPFNGVSFGNHSAPSFFDIDGDGDLDMFTGSQDGTIKYFRNDGGTYVQQTGANNPFSSIDVGDNSTPQVTRFNGVVSLIVGNAAGQLNYWYIDPSSGTLVHPSISPFGSAHTSGNSAPAIADLYADGHPDLFLGGADGQILYYQDGSVQETGASNPFTIPGAGTGPTNVDVGSNSNVAFGDLDGDGDLDAVVGAADGTIHYFENTFASYFPVFVERTGSANPFNGINIGTNSHVTLVDLDHDGDADLVVADDNGNLRYFLNNQPSTSVLIHVNAQSEGPSLLGLDGPGPVFSEGVTTAPLVTDVTFTALNNNFNGGEMIVSGLDPLDRLSIHNQGTGAGQIGLSGANVTYGGVTIGTWSGGVGQNLVVHFNGAATTTSIQALANDLQFTSVGDSPTEFRTLSFYVSDATGQVADGPFIPSDHYFAPLDTDNPFYSLNISSVVGTRAAPALIDYDNDGNLDLVVGLQNGTMAAFHGSSDGSYTQMTGAANPFAGVSVSGDAKISFGDVDHDGDLDLVVGGTDGTIHYFKDVAGTYVEQTGGNNPFGSIDVGTDSSPTLVDIDGDGDLDLVVGGASVDGQEGTAHTFQNNGGVFTQLTGANDPLNGNIVAGARLSVVFGDVDGDGDLDMVVGGSSMAIQYFENTGTRSAPVFTHESAANDPFAGAFSGVDSSLTLVDYDHDGDLDLIVGESNGGPSNLHYFQNNMPLPGILVQVTPINDAPVVAASSVDAGAVLEDDMPFGTTVSVVAASAFSDPDGANSATGMLGGIAITGNAESGQGNWQYFDGSDWQNIGTSMSDGSALVILASTLIRFVPTANYNGAEPALTAHLLDSSYLGQTGDIVDLTSGTGGQSAYSTGTFTITGSVTAVNDAPVVAQSTVSLTAIDENSANPAGQTIASFASIAFSDPYDALFGETPNHFLGIVIVANFETTEGHWQFSDDGTNWTNVGHPRSTSGLGLHATTQLRFVPTAGYFGAAPTLQAYLIDDSSGDFFTTGRRTFSITGFGDNGGSTHFSADKITIGETVTLVDQPPVVAADMAATQAVESGAAVTGNVLANDSDPDHDTLTVSAVNGGGAGSVGTSVAGTYGHITISSSGDYSYTADITSAIDAAGTGSHLSDSFTYTADDGHGGTTSTTVTIMLDRAPTVVDDSFGTIVEGASTGLVAAESGVLVDDSDRDGDSITILSVAGDPANLGNPVATTYGHITLNANGSYTYLADNTAAIDAAIHGSHPIDMVTFVVSDGHGGTTTETLSFNIDRAPTVVSDSFGTIVEGASTGLVAAASGVLVNDSDNDGDSLTVFSVGGSTSNVGNATATTYGHITLNANGSYTYVADNTSAIDAATSGSHPIDTVTFLVSDGHGGTTTETLSFTIDRAPTASADMLHTAESAQAVTGSNGNLNLLANDVDKDGDAIAITAVNGDTLSVGKQVLLASGALLTVNADGTYTYDPNHAFDYLPDSSSGASNTTATDTFTYTIDGGSTITVTVTITGQDSDDVLVGTSGADTLNGGNGNDIFYDDDGRSGSLHDTSAGNSGGIDAFNGGSGDDSFSLGKNLTASDRIDGGIGTDRVTLDGNYTGANAVVFNATTMLNVEDLTLTVGNSYNLTINNATVAAGQVLTVQAGTLGVGNNLTFDGSADTTGGQFVITAGAGNDVLIGGHGNDKFVVGSGNDTVHGGDGNDKIVLGANLTSADVIDGGSGSDVLYLNGDYSSGVVFGATTLSDVENIVLSAGFSYDFTLNDANLTAGQTLVLNAKTLQAGDNVTFDGSAETGGVFVINTGGGDDVLSGGAQSDVFHTGSGNDTVHGGGGDDVVNMGADFTAADTIDGGMGHDVVLLDGNYQGGIVFTATTLTNVELIALAAGHSYSLTTNDATVAAGEMLTVRAGGLGAAASLTFDGSAEMDGSFSIRGGAGNDTITGGALDDVLRAGNGTNTLAGGGGADGLFAGAGVDTFVYKAASDSLGTAHDHIYGFNANQDFIGTEGFTVNAIDTAVTIGRLRGDTFDSDLTQAIGTEQLDAHDAVLFTASRGGLAGHTFLVVDVNGIAGYQAGQDLVIDVTGATHLGSFDLGNFTS